MPPVVGYYVALERKGDRMIVASEIVRFSKRLSLESGRTLNGFEIAYETYGSLNREKDNAVLICHGLTAGAHAAGRHTETDPRLGWWDTAIGPGKSFDTDRYFVLCSNVLGGCGGSTGPSSTDPSRGLPYGLRFPVLTVRDMVWAQARLANHLGIERFHSVVGGCFGGFQVLQWMCAFPERVTNAIVISSAYSTSTHNLGLWEVFRQAIMRDPHFNGGDYYGKKLPRSGIGLGQMFGMMIWMSPETMRSRFGLRFADDMGPSYSMEPDFAFQRFLHKVGAHAADRFDPNSLLYLTKAMDYFDLSRGRKSLADAFADCQCRTLLVSYKNDWRYPPENMDLIRVALMQNNTPVEHRILDSDFGHGAFIYDSEGVLRLISAFMASAGTK